MANVITVAVTESNVTVTETPLNVNVSTTDDTITVTESSSVITVADSVSNIVVSNTTFNTITSNTDLSIANLSVSGNVDVGGNSELSGNVRVGSNATVNTMITNVDVQTGKIVMERDIPYTDFNGARARQIDIQTVDYNAASNVYTTTGLNDTGLRIVMPAGANSAYDGMQIPAISFNYGDTISSSGGYSAANPFNIAFEYNGAGSTTGNLLLSSGSGTGMAGNENRVKINTFTDIDGVLTLANGLVVGKNSPDPEVTHSLDILAGNDIGFLGTPSTTRGNIEGVGNINAVGNITTLGTFIGDGSGLTGLPSNAQAQAYIQDNGLNGSGDITMTGVATFGNAATQTHTFTGNVDVTGNIEVSGNLNYRNVEDLYVRDQSITLNANAASDATVSIIANRPVAGANTVLRWNETSDIWEFTNDGSTYYPIPTSTSDLAEGTNLYFTNARANTVSRAALSVTTNSPSGNGSLSYSNTTGVFTFTPADTSTGGGGNYDDSNVTTLLSGGTISNITMDSGLLVTRNDATNNFKINGSDVRWNTNNFTQATRISHFNDSTSVNAVSNEWWRYGGNIASPTGVANKMLVSNQRYYGYDGVRSIIQGSPNARYDVFVDTDNGGAVAANNVPLSHEFVVQPDAMEDNGGVSVTEKAMLTLTANGHIYFNRSGSKGDYGEARANIDPDGNFRANSNITAVGNISGTYILGDGSQLSNLPSGISNAQAQSYIQSSGLAMTADITSDSLIKTTGNLQVNADTDVSGLSGLTFDSATNNLGLGTPTPKAALHIRGTSNETQIFMTEYNGTSSAGPDIRTFRAGGSEASPTVTPKSDRIFARNHYAYDGTGTSGDGISTGFQNAFTEQIITDPTIDHASEVVPVFHQYYTYLDGDATTTPHALMRMRSNGDIQFSIANAFDYTDAANAVIKNDGTLTTTGVSATGNITTTANVSGNYILGDGSQLTNLPSGVSNAQAQAFIQTSGLAMTANVTSNSLISTTGNVQINPDTTSAIGMKGLTYRSDYNLLGLGTTSPQTALDIVCDQNVYAQIYLREYADNFFGPDLTTFKARGSVASPTAVSVGDRLMELKPSGYSGSGFLNSMGQIMYVDSANAISSTSMPIGFSWEGYKDGDTGGSYQSLMKLRSNGDFQIGSLGFGSSNNDPNFAVTHGGDVSIKGSTTFTNANVINGEISTISNVNINTGVGSSSTLSNVAVTLAVGNTNAGISTDLQAFTGGQIFADGTQITNNSFASSPWTGYNGNTYFLKYNSGQGAYELWNDSGFTSAVLIGGSSFTGTGDSGQAEYTGSTTFPVGGNLNVGGSNVVVESLGGNVTTVGNVSGNYFIGNGSLLTGITGGGGGGITNAQAQSFIQSSGLTMTAAISSNTTLGTTGNLDLNIATAVDNLYGVRFDSATNKFISSPTLTAQAPTHFITVEKEGTDLEFISSRVARSGANGTRLLFEKSEGTLASPSALGNYDAVWETEYSGWDGNKYENSFGTHVFQDTRTAGVSADTVPLAYEFYAKPSGDTTEYDDSIMSLHSDGKIVFNDAGGARGFNTKTGTANISADGKIHSASNITSDTYVISQNLQLDNANVISGVVTTSANININTRTDTVPANTTVSVSDVQAYNNGSLTEDSITIPGGQIIADGTAVTYSGATTSAVTPLNGLVFYVKFNSGDGGRYELFDNSDFSTGSRRVTGGGFSSSGVGQIEYVSTATVAAGGNLNVGGSNAVIQSLGGNITSVGNISGNYIIGDGSQLTNIPGTTDSFGTVIVAGQTNIQATQANAQLTLASSGAITLSTSGNTVTIGGTGGTYGNTDVETFLGSDTMTGDVTYKGNLQLSSANVSTAVTNYQGNAYTATGDRIIVGSDPGWFNGQYVTFSGTSNAALTFLNGNTYQVAGSGTAWTLYTNYQTFTKLETALNEESPTGLTTSYRQPENTTARVHGNVFVEQGGTMHTDALVASTPGKVITLNAIRATDFKVNDPLGIYSVANSSISGLTPFTGSIIYVTGDRHGARGAPAYFDGSDFRYFSDDALVTT